MSIVMVRVLLMAAESHLGCLPLFAQRLRANGQPKRSHNYCYVNREDWSGSGYGSGQPGVLGTRVGGPIDFYVMCLLCDFT